MQKGIVMVADELGRIWNEAIMAYFKVMFQHMLKLIRGTTTLLSD
jgi:hypothetical protein